MRRSIQKGKSPSLAFVCLASAIISLTACATRQAPSPVTLPESTPVKSMAVMPYIDMYKIYGDNISFNCPLCGRSEVISKVSEGADEFLTEALYTKLKERGGYQLISPGQVQGVQSTILLNPEQNVADLDMILNIGRDLGVDAVLLGRVYRFREREGSDFSAQTPAAVTFDLLLIYVKDGQLLWEGNFSETQQALTENLFNFSSFVDRGGRWLTAEELAVNGMENVMATFPNAN